jgi:ADP-ribose pyrophosphatase YjhB (NUDIX family)
MDQIIPRTISRRRMESSAVNAVGVWFYAVNTQRYLYLMRDDPKHPDTWGLPGGRMEPGETMIESIKRECEEELGAMPDYIKLVPLEKFTTADQHFAYHTFFCSVASEFVPELNHEHTGWAWLSSGVWPRPMHPGLWSTVNFDAVRDKITTMELAVQTSQ